MRVRPRPRVAADAAAAHVSCAVLRGGAAAVQLRLVVVVREAAGWAQPGQRGAAGRLQEDGVLGGEGGEQQQQGGHGDHGVDV